MVPMKLLVPILCISWIVFLQGWAFYLGREQIFRYVAELRGSSDASISLSAGREELDGQPNSTSQTVAGRTHHEATCAAQACTLAAEDAPLLYTMDLVDGLGHRMRHILSSLAVAQSFGMNFGGLYSLGNQITEQGCNLSETVEAFFGDSQLLIRSQEKWPEIVGTFPRHFETPRQLFEARAGITEGKVFLWRPIEWDDRNLDVAASLLFPLSFRSLLQEPLLKFPLLFAPGKPRIAVHVRRGDIDAQHFRYVPDAYFLGHVARVRQLFPEADVHIWSSTLRESGHKDLHWNTSDFERFQQSGISVHLDESSILEAWAHMATADVFIASPSSFSLVPAILNKRCVIHGGMAPKPLPGWVDGRIGKSAEAKERELRTCIHGGVAREGWWEQR